MTCPYSPTNLCFYPRCCINGSAVLDGSCLEANGPIDGLRLNLRGGRQIDLRNPDVKDIRIEDIAAALSKICRYAGHVPKFYSVAQHSCLVAQLLPRDLQLAGLLHDGSEAYLNDITRALKHSPEMHEYRCLEDTMQRAVFRRFGLPEEMHSLVKAADRDITQIEYNTMMLGETNNWPLIQPYDPERSEGWFLSMFETLTTVEPVTQCWICREWTVNGGPNSTGDINNPTWRWICNSCLLGHVCP